MKKLLEIENLKTYFYTEAGTAKAVDGFNMELIIITTKRRGRDDQISISL